MTAEHEGPAGPDALMAALTDEPLPESAREDPAFLAAHRSAEADLALLREQLGVIGDALAAAEPAQAPRPPRPAGVRSARVRRHAVTVAFGSLAVAAVAAVLSGLAWLLSQGTAGTSDASSDTAADSASSAASGGDEQESGGATRFGGPRYLACARTVAEGTVTRVERLPDDELRVTVRVTRFYKPEQSGEPDADRAPTGTETTLVTSRSAFSEERAPEAGDPVLYGIPRDATTPDHWVVGEREVAQERAWITASLPESRKLTCD